MTLFDQMDRDDVGLPASGETQFSYLNRSARIEAERVRTLLNVFVDRYPATHRGALVSRLRSPIDDVHTSALFELVLHELIIRAGHRIASVEPALPHTSRSPDFLVETAKDDRFYLEAVLATGRSQQETAAIARLESAVGIFENLKSPNFYIMLHVEGLPIAPVTLRKLRSRLEHWISILHEDRNRNNIPSFEYNEHGVTFRASAVRRHPALTIQDRAVGARSYGARMLIPGEGVRDSLEKKASRYGRLDAPYIVAINATGIISSERDVVDALFGSPQLITRRYEDGRIEEFPARAPDGVWVKRKPRNTGLSAVLSFERVQAWSIGQRSGRLIRNPWAAAPLPPTRLFVAEHNLQNGELVATPGQSLAEIFDLPNRWPE